MSHKVEGGYRNSEVRLLGDFAAAMAERLDANSFKDGWENDSPRALLNRLRQETDELRRALSADAETVGHYVQRVTRECADVANFAAMIADVVRLQAEREADERYAEGLAANELQDGEQ